MAKRKKINATRITTAVALVIFVLVLVSFWVVLAIGSNTQDTIKGAIETQYTSLGQEVSSEVAHVLEEEMKGVQSTLEIMSRIPEINEGEGVDCSKELKDITESNELPLGNIGRVNKEGTFYCGVVDAIIGVDGLQYDYLKQIIQDDPNHNSVLSPAVEFQYTDHSRFLAALHVPVYTEGEFSGTLGGAIYFDEWEEQFLHEIEFAQRGFLTILDHNGDILYQVDNELVGENIFDEAIQVELNTDQLLDTFSIIVEEGGEGVLKYERAGQEYIVAYAVADAFEGRNWVVIIEIPVEEVEGVYLPLVRNLNQQVFFVYAIMILLVLGTLHLLLRWNRQLTMSVAKRTEEIETKNKALEKADATMKDTLASYEQLNEMLTGRELKMVELKRQIDELTQQKNDSQ